MSLKVSGFSSAALDYKIVYYDNTSNPATDIQENVTGSSGRWYSITATNHSGSPIYVRLSDGSAPVIGTTACDWQFFIPAEVNNIPTTKTIEVPGGVPFATALNFWTGGNADPKSNVAPASGGITVTIVTS